MSLTRGYNNAANLFCQKIFIEKIKRQNGCAVSLLYLLVPNENNAIYLFFCLRFCFSWEHVFRKQYLTASNEEIEKEIL